MRARARSTRARGSSASSSSAPRATSGSPTRPPPAQYFHLLRRQARLAKPRPLVVFTPKGLLRLRAAASSLEDLTTGSFKLVIDDPRSADRPREEIDRLVLCSGKLFYDIDGHERRETTTNVAVARVELLYPFARNEIRTADRVATRT